MRTEGKGVTLTEAEIHLLFKRRDRLSTFWRVALSISLVLGVVVIIMRLVAGLPPTWGTVLTALWALPTARWLYDDHCRTKLVRMLSDRRAEL